MEFGDGLAVPDLTYKLCERLHRVIVNMKGNKKRSEQLSQTVKALQTLILTIKKKAPSQISEPILNALQEVKTSLACAEVMLIKYSQSRGIERLVKSKSFDGKFQDMNQRLNENYFTLSGALQAEHGDVLQKVDQTPPVPTTVTALVPPPVHIMAASPYFFPPPPVPTMTIIAPSPGLIVSPLSPIPSIPTQVVVSSTLSPPLAPIMTSYTIQRPFFS